MHVDERSAVEGLVGGGGGLAEARDHHLHGLLRLEGALEEVLLRGELHGRASPRVLLGPLPLERQDAMELLHSHTTIINSSSRHARRRTGRREQRLTAGRKRASERAYLGRREEDGGGGGGGEEGQVAHHRSRGADRES